MASGSVWKGVYWVCATSAALSIMVNWPCRIYRFPAFDAATQPQSTSVLLANGHGLEDARWRRVIDATGSPARYVAAVPQRTRKSLAAVYGLQVAVRRAVRTASQRLVGFLRPFVRPAPVGAVGLGLAGLEVSPTMLPQHLISPSGLNPQVW